MALRVPPLAARTERFHEFPKAPEARITADRPFHRAPLARHGVLLEKGERPREPDDHPDDNRDAYGPRLEHRSGARVDFGSEGYHHRPVLHAGGHGLCGGGPGASRSALPGHGALGILGRHSRVRIDPAGDARRDGSSHAVQDAEARRNPAGQLQGGNPGGRPGREQQGVHGHGPLRKEREMAVTTKIPEAQLFDYFDRFTKRFLRDDSPEYASVEVLSPDWGEQYESEGEALIGITYDHK